MTALLCWSGGILFLVTFVGSITDRQFGPAFFALLLSVVLLPPVYARIERGIGRRVPSWQRAVVGAACFFGLGMVIEPPTQKTPPAAGQSHAAAPVQPLSAAQSIQTRLQEKLAEKLVQVDTSAYPARISFTYNTGPWLWTDDYELRQRIIPAIFTTHEIARQFAPLQRVDLQIVAPAAATRDEYGNEVPPGNVILVMVSLDASDLLKFETVAHEAVVYIVNRYRPSVHPKLLAQWEESAATGAKWTTSGDR